MIQLSETAAEKIKGLLSQQNLAETAGLRVYANSGCCSNNSYGMALEPESKPEDQVFETQGIRVLVDPASLEQLEGASIDYYKDEHAEGFAIHKPQSHSHCGCGGGCNC